VRVDAYDFSTIEVPGFQHQVETDGGFRAAAGIFSKHLKENLKTIQSFGFEITNK